MNHRTRLYPHDSSIAVQPHQVPKVMIDTIDSVDFQFNRNGNDGIFTSTFVAAKNARTVGEVETKTRFAGSGIFGNKGLLDSCSWLKLVLL